MQTFEGGIQGVISEGAFLAPVRRTFALWLWKVRPWAGGPRRGQLWRARVPPVAQNTRVWLFSVHTALAVPEVLVFFLSPFLTYAWEDGKD